MNRAMTWFYFTMVFFFLIAGEITWAILCLSFLITAEQDEEINELKRQLAQGACK